MCKKAWCTCKVVVLLINLLLCLLFSLPSPSPSSLLKLSIVVIQKFCYHGNVTSHWPLSIGPVLLSKTIFRHWNSFLSSAAEGGKSMDWCNLFKPYYYAYKNPPQKIIIVSTRNLVYMMKFAVWSYLLHNSTGAKPKLNCKADTTAKGWFIGGQYFGWQN